jgi:dienelactone hydrolase
MRCKGRSAAYAAIVLLAAASGCGLDGPIPTEKKGAEANPGTASPSGAASSDSPKQSAGVPGGNSAPRAAADRGDGYASTLDVTALVDLPPWKADTSGNDTVEVSLKIPANTPGHADRLILYVPHGQHARHSLGCVLIAPAGAPIYAGNSQGNGDRVEHLPYVKAGYAVVAFDIDGAFDGGNASEANVQSTYAKFKAAGGGVVNGKNALEYVLAKLPEVDPERVYAAGHSSAAIWALLFAENEPRIKGCIAYAPLADLFGRNPSQRAAFEQSLSGIARLSPQENVERLKCPVFIFHAEDDTNVPIGITRRFVDLLKQTNSIVTFHTVPTGGHYDSMIAEGIPQGIQWLRSLPAEANQQRSQPASPRARRS